MHDTKCYFANLLYLVRVTFPNQMGLRAAFPSWPRVRDIFPSPTVFRLPFHRRSFSTRRSRSTARWTTSATTCPSRNRSRSSSFSPTSHSPRGKLLTAGTGRFCEAYVVAQKVSTALRCLSKLYINFYFNSQWVQLSALLGSQNLLWINSF